MICSEQLELFSSTYETMKVPLSKPFSEDILLFFEIRPIDFVS